MWFLSLLPRWWVQVRTPGGQPSLNLHFDADEEHKNHAGEHIPPWLATVTYLGSRGAPTLILPVVGANPNPNPNPNPNLNPNPDPNPNPNPNLHPQPHQVLLRQRGLLDASTPASPASLASPRTPGGAASSLLMHEARYLVITPSGSCTRRTPPTTPDPHPNRDPHPNPSHFPLPLATDH